MQEIGPRSWIERESANHIDRIGRIVQTRLVNLFSGLRLDSHADTGALIPSVDWLKRCFSIFLAIHHPFFYANQRLVSKRRCLHEDSANKMRAYALYEIQPVIERYLCRLVSPNEKYPVILYYDWFLHSDPAKI